MSSNNDDTTTDAPNTIKEGKLGVDEERIIEELIFNQAESLVDGVREGIQNGVDAPGSTEVTVSMTPERTTIEDDGEGMDMTDEKVERFLTHLGASTKRDDEAAIGQFGIGFGQMLAKGKVTVHTRDTKVQFDAKNWYRDYRIFEADEHYDGFRVEIEHYEDEVPEEDSSRWDRYHRKIRNRFKFMELVHGVEVTLNGETVSDKTVEDEMYKMEDRYEDDEMIIGVRPKDYDRINVYSAGIKVTSISGDGLSGYVVTKENLELNTARNAISSGCELFERVQAQLDEMRSDLLGEMEGEEMTDSMRKGAAAMLREGHDQFADKEMFKLANGEYTSLEQIQARDSVCWAEADSRVADKLADYGEMVLMSDDPANQHLASADGKDQLDIPKLKDAAATASSLGLSTGYDEKEVTKKIRNEIAMARIMAHKMGIDREIKFGEDPAANAWTDGEEYICITESAWTSRKYAVWMHQIYRILCHEAAHNEDSSGEPSHGDEFNRQFRKLADEKENAFTELIAEVEEEGLGTVLKSYRDIHDTQAGW